jgi:pyruvate dehydrogenase E2 component (dihydrolipoamide acetyltransferase)
LSDFTVPELGENVAGGDVAKVLVKVGDTVRREQPVIELETDKATVEVPSSVAGVVTDIKVKTGDNVKVGQVIFTVSDNGAGSAAVPSEPARAVASAPAATASPRPPEPAAAAREAAAPTSAPAPAAAARSAAAPAAGAPAAEPAQPAHAEPPRAEPRDQKVVPMPQRPSAAAPEPPAPTAVGAPSANAAPASPAVRRLAREIGVDVNTVMGSGPGGRISQEDVKEHARRILSSLGTSGAAALTSPSRATRALPDFAKWGEVERQPWTNVRRVTAEHLSYAWNTIPHVTQFDKADVTALEELRKRYKEQVARAGGNLTVTAMLVKVLATAVQKFPQFNASLDSERGEIVHKKYVNVGVAVDTDRGLFVPVIRDANRKNITRIATELQELAQKARDRKLTVDDMSGGGISISNLGGIGGTAFTPIVNWPEVAILGVSRGTIEPVWQKDQFVPRQLLPLSLSYDHRVIDGADAMRFLRWVVEAIEQPFLLSLIG